MARQAQAGAAAVRRDVHRAQRREDLVVGPLVLQHLLERAQQLVAAQARQRQRAPRDPQLHPEGGLVRAVAAHVTDHRVHGAVRRADDVVEVTAEQGARAARAVAGGEPQRRALQQRGRQQTALQAAVLLGPQAALGEPALGRLGTLALHRVADRAAQQPSVQLVAEQVVLGTHAHRLRAALGVARRGQRQDGMPGRELQHVLEHGELVLGVAVARRRQREVQQDAVDVVGQQPPGLGQIAGRADADRLACLVEHVRHDGRTGRVVLDQQQRQIGVSGVVLHLVRDVPGGVRRARGHGRGVRDGVLGGAAARGRGLRLTTLHGRDRSLPRYGYGHRLGFLPSPRGHGGGEGPRPTDGDHSGCRRRIGMV